jgi:cysteinyl-tRNA synthetase
MLKIYDSLQRAKVPFQPMKAGKISLYVCGNTVYDDCHLGHARSMICFDVIVRFLRSQNYQVTYVRNITDIDDKIIVRALERNLSINDLTAHYIQSQNADTQALSIIKPDQEPRATEYIPAIIELIEHLIALNHAYVSDHGDVCYAVESFEAYGKLSHKDIEGLLAGARVDVVASKRSPLDFVLWKMSKPDEPSWDSPWGKGRPGWHIECSAMAMKTLGETFDIHGGGADLQFPHHENEIAQSEGATQKPLANYWLHVGMLQLNSEKMAKSTGNFFTVKTLLNRYHPEIIRYFLISSHYRSTINYTEDNMQNAAKALQRMYQTLSTVAPVVCEIAEDWRSQWVSMMNDDFNTPEALSVLFNLCRTINKTKSPQLAYTLQQLAQSVGLLMSAPDVFLKQGSDSLDSFSIEQMIEKRQRARQSKNWALADEIRQSLQAQGIELDDSATGTTWRNIQRS